MNKVIIAIWLLASLLFAEDNIRQDALLICLKQQIEPLHIQRDNGSISVSEPELDVILKELNVQEIQPWISAASDNDNDGPIYLNRIYRVFLESENNRQQLDLQKMRIESASIVYSVEYEYVRRPLYTPNDNQYNQQWFLPQIIANDAWDFWDIGGGDTPGDKSILLASVDTGVDWDHPDLRNNIWNNPGEDADGDGVTIVQQGNTWVFDPDDINDIDDDGNGYIDDFIGWDCSGFSNDIGNIGGGTDNNPLPPSGVSSGGTWAHGTHVAGLLSATTNNNTGIASAAFNCSIMAVKVSTGEQDYPYITHGYDGILYAAKAGFHAGDFTIINNSWGGIGYSQFEQATINIAHDQYNAVIVAAGGNGDEDGLGTDEFAHFPSSYDNVISVCPLGTGDSWNHWATYHESIDIASPGEDIRSTKIGTGYATWDGSSMASPIVGSVLGLMRSFHPEWNNLHLETMLLGTANPNIYNINPQGYLQGKLGSGRVDALAAITTDLFPNIELAELEIMNNSGNEQIIQGDVVEILAILYNNPDWGYASDVHGSITLVEDNNDITILSNEIEFNDAGPGDVLLNEIEPFIIEFGANTSIGDIDFQLQITSNENGNIQYNHTADFILNVAEQSVMIGDLNQDELINVLDIVQIVNIILGQEPSAYQQEAGDLNLDGSLNVLDIVNMINIILDN